MQTILVPFHDDVLEALLIRDGESQVVYVVCKRIAENLGLEWSSQLLVLREHEILGEELLNVDINIEGIGTREAVCLPFDHLPYWLAGIQTKRVSSDIRPKLLLYQKECVRVLARYFLGDGVVINPEDPVFSHLDILDGMLAAIRREHDVNASQDKHLHELDTDVEYLTTNKADKTELAMLKAKMEADKQRRQEHARKEFPDWVKHWVWDQTNGRCMKCRRKLIPEGPRGSDDRPQYDHITPKTCGGRGLITNCQLLCSKCNREKSGCIGPCRNAHPDFRPVDLVYEAEQLLIRHVNGSRPHDDQLGLF